MSSSRPGRKATISDVATRAGVDRAVVSKVLSGDERLSVRETTRERVLFAARELDYRPNAAARSLRTARASAYGLLIPDFGNPIFASIIKGAEAAAAERGCLLLTGSLAEGGFGAGGYLDVLEGGRVDGLLLAGELGDLLVGRLERLQSPWLLLNRRTPGAERFVVLDDERAAGLAVAHLAALGHRRIAHLAGPAGADTAQRRRSGYLEAARAANLKPSETLVEAADYTSEGGSAAMGRLLRRDEPPTAVFVANVASAVGALHAAKSAGFRVPEDVSVVAVHDLPLASYLDPPLTTVRMPLEQLGRRGVELLVSEPADATIREVLHEPMELVVRGSSAPPPALTRRRA